MPITNLEIKNKSWVINNLDIIQTLGSTIKSKNRGGKIGSWEANNSVYWSKDYNINLVTYGRSIQEELMKLKEDTTGLLGIGLFI